MLMRIHSYKAGDLGADETNVIGRSSLQKERKFDVQNLLCQGNPSIQKELSPPLWSTDIYRPTAMPTRNPTSPDFYEAFYRLDS